MALLIAEPSELSAAIERALNQTGEEVSLSTPDDERLFMKAINHRGLIYLASSSILNGSLNPRPDRDRAHKILKATNAPGLRLVIFCLPEGDGYEPERETLVRYGKPYMIVRSPLLLEEVAEVLNQDGERSIWMPSDGSVRATQISEIAQLVLTAYKAGGKGRTLASEAETMSAATLFSAAAELARGITVHSVRPGIWKLIRPWAKRIKGREPAALELYDQLFTKGPVRTPQAP